MLENPYSLHPATGKDFIGRTDILSAWRERLTPNSESWNSAKSWMVVGAGGMGKTSLLHELIRIANDEFMAHTISIDLGRLREIEDTEDLFTTLSMEMPEARQPGTKLRKWFGLQPNAPLSDLVGQITGELLNQVTNFAIGVVGGGIKVGNFRQTPSDQEGVAHRLAQFLINLSLLSEEQDAPVVVLLDQVGKCHDHPTWAYIAGMFLGLCKKMRSARASQIFFVVSLRPEQEGLLRHQIDRRLFEKDIFIPIDLYPFSFDEAIEAVTIRGGAYINRNLARRIVTEINNQGPLDPYTIQLSSMAVWNYIQGDEDSHSPTELEADAEKLRTIIKQGHAEIIHPFMQDPTLWSIFVHLSQSRGGLTISQIYNSLIREHNLSMLEVKSAVDRLLNPPRTGYRLLTEIRDEHSPNLYALAHDLLRDYIFSIIPHEQRLINQANRTLEYGVWRYQERGELLNEWELQLLSEVHPYLTFKSEHWATIINSELVLGSRRLFLWQDNYPKEIAKVCVDNLQVPGSKAPNIRLVLFSWFISSRFDQAQIQLTEDIQGVKNKSIRSGMISSRKQAEESAFLILTELIRSDKDGYVSYSAIKTLGQMGEAALPILTELAQNEDEFVSIKAIRALGQRGEAALPILIQLARAKHGDCRSAAIKALGQIGEAALPILTELARIENDFLRRDAAEALAQVGEVALPLLTELSRSDRDLYRRSSAAEALGQIGEAALPLLTELAQDEDSYLRLMAVEALGQIGPPSLPLLKKLARDKNRDHLNIVIKALGQVGEVALPILTELARGEYFYYRRLATSALGQIGEAALPILTELAQDEDKNVRWIAGPALGKAGLPILTEMARQADIEVRKSAAEALGQVGESALPILTELARDNHKDVRRIAAESLGRLGEPAFPIIVRLAKDLDDVVSGKAIGVLGQMGEPAFPILRELVRRSRDRDQYERATIALGQLGKIANEELFFMAVVEPLSQRGSIAAITLMNNVLSEFFSINQ